MIDFLEFAHSLVEAIFQGLGCPHYKPVFFHGAYLIRQYLVFVDGLVLAKSIVLKCILYQFNLEVWVEFVKKSLIHWHVWCLERLQFLRPIGSKNEVFCARVNSVWDSTQTFYVPFLKSQRPTSWDSPRVRGFTPTATILSMLDALILVNRIDFRLPRQPCLFIVFSGDWYLPPSANWVVRLFIGWAPDIVRVA